MGQQPTSPGRPAHLGRHQGTSPASPVGRFSCRLDPSPPAWAACRIFLTSFSGRVLPAIHIALVPRGSASGHWSAPAEVFRHSYRSKNLARNSPEGHCVFYGNAAAAGPLKPGIRWQRDHPARIRFFAYRAHKEWRFPKGPASSWRDGDPTRPSGGTPKLQDAGTVCRVRQTPHIQNKVTCPPCSC